MGTLYGFPASKKILMPYIEMVQRRAVRFIFNNYSYNTSVTSLLNTLNWPNLQNHRINLRAIMLYQTHFFCITPPPHVINTTATRSVPTYSSFFPFSIRIWNYLSPQTACSPSLKIFKDKISKQNLPTRFILNL